MKIPEPPNATRFFARLGVAFLLAGGLLAWFLSRNRVDPDYASYLRMTAPLTVIIAGICFIIASAKWWMKR